MVILMIFLLVSPAFAMHGGGSGGGGGGGGGCGMDCGESPLATFTTNDFSGSGNCAMCHSSLRDASGNDVSIDTHWRSTTMANAAKDPLWQAKIESEINRTPDFQAVIEDKCTRCHMPMARTQALTDGMLVAVLGDGFLNPANPLNAAAMDGVSCSLCHQIQAAGLGSPDTFTGNYVIDTSTSAPDRLIFGKFSNPRQGPMRMHVGYTPVKGTQTTLSGLCGSCHTLFTPIVDAYGNVLGEFPEQMTYLEWEHSEFGDGVGTDATCQECHLPVAVGNVKISNRPKQLSARNPFEQHFLVGGNAFMLNLLKDNLVELGITASAAQLEDTIARVTDQLQAQTAALTVEDASVLDGTLTFTLSVQNLAGHKLPSGIPARRVWLYVSVTDANGTLIFESGKPLSDGRIAGNNADEDRTTFEPHYDVIYTPDQVQIYEPVMVDDAGQVTFTLLRASEYLKDNRLLPGGFDKATASEDIAVQGEAAWDDDFTGGSDQVSYVIDVDGFSAPLVISAQLLYQAVSYPFQADLSVDTTPLVERFAAYYAATDNTGVILAAVEQTPP